MDAQTQTNNHTSSSSHVIRSWYETHYTGSFENYEQALGAARVYKSQKVFWETVYALLFVLTVFYLALLFLVGALFTLNIATVTIVVLVVLIPPFARWIHIDNICDVCDDWMRDHQSSNTGELPVRGDDQ